MRQEKSLEEQNIQESDIFKSVLENERVRVLKVQIKPGEETKAHSHPYHIVCALNDQKLKFKSVEGEDKEFELNSGKVLYFEPVTHVVENIGETDALSIVIELKESTIPACELD